MSSYGGASTGTSLGTEELPTISEAERLERKSLVVWRRPWMTLKYSILETCLLLIKLGLSLLDRRLLGGILILVIIYCVPGPHEPYVLICEQNLGFAIYWLGLGLLSSVGFGTGLHTFLMYLGPHIAAVTLAAYECQTLDFPMPPYPDEKLCPKEPYGRHVPTVWQILTKVRIESLLWGVGTALGELPPYFMAKAARLSGKCVEERQEMAELQRCSRNLSLFERGKLLVERAVLRLGFFGILLCASVPNPLFDLAGVACGHFLVPFWKFFVATLIGKAFIKATIQQLIVVVAFSEDLVKVLVNSLIRIPWLGPTMQLPIQNMLASTKLRMHRKIKEDSATELGLAIVFQLFTLIIIAFCVVSLLNALAQEHCKRRQDQKREQNAQETEMEIQSTDDSE